MFSTVAVLFSLLRFGHQAETTPYTFRYVAQQPAHHVFVAGDFNNWNANAKEMAAQPDGKTFTATLDLSFGKHFYKFVVDGQWTIDPGNPNSQPDGDGHTNSFVVIQPPDYAQPAAIGDGVIARSALHHEQALPYLNFDEGKLQFRFRARPGDIASISLLISGQPARPMTQISESDFFASYEASVAWNLKTDLEYVFKLNDGPTTLYYGPRGVTASPEGNRFKLDAANYHPFVVPEWVQKSVIYQIFPERFANWDPSNDGPGALPWGGKPTFSNRFGGDLAGVDQHFSYLKDLGISCIYFNPIFEGPANHGYETDDYLKIDHRFGTNEQFDSLVKKWQASGVRVVLDGVFNHTSRGFFAFNDVVKNGAASPYTGWYFFHGFPVRLQDPINYEGWFGFGSLPKLNNPNPEVRKYLLNIPKFWQDQAPLGGWRLDAANEVVDDYWVLFRKTVKALNPNLWICGEIWGDASHWLKGDMYDSVMNYRFRDAILGFLGRGGNGKPSAFGKSLMETYGLSAPQVSRNLMNLVDSHDTERIINSVGFDRKLADLAAILQFTWVGTPSIYYGDELGMQGDKDPDNRRCMDWSLANDGNPTLKLYKKLVAMRNSLPELQLGRPVPLMADDAKGIFAFARIYKGREVMVFVNRSSAAQVCTFKGDYLAGHYRDVLSGKPFSTDIELAPESAQIFAMGR